MIGWMHRIFFQRVHIYDTHRWFPRKKKSQVLRDGTEQKKQTNERTTG